MKNLQIRNVDEKTHRALKMRAAAEGRSLSELALSELRRSLERPTRGEVLDRLAKRERFDVQEGSAEAVRHERGPI